MCWRTYFLRRMESLAKGIHYNICACARKESNGRLKENTEIRKGIAWHPGLDMSDIRVSACSTSGSRHVRHPGVGHKKKAYGRNDTGRKQYRNMQRKERQKEKVNTMFKEYFYSLFLCSRPIIHFFEQYIPLVHTYNPLVTNIIYHQQHYTFNFLGFFLHNGAEL